MPNEQNLNDKIFILKYAQTNVLVKRTCYFHYRHFRHREFKFEVTSRHDV